MRPILLLILTLFFQGALFANNHDKVKSTVKNVSGKITSVNGEELAGARITIKETNETFYADLSGNFNFQVKTDRQYSITFQGIGYSPLEKKSAELGLFCKLSLEEL